mmetsp:Transcript_27195/g.64719  ORF Transcript_27195/g.64719 Transcript_27195/m.64719 type:complete len:277 (+) Transcript_27195:430-1260(+)
MDSNVKGWMALVSMFRTFSVRFARSDTAKMAASWSWRFVQPISKCSMCELLSMATASLGDTRGSRLPSGIFRLVKSNFDRVGSSKCARWTIQIIQFPIFPDDRLAVASRSSAWSSVGSVQAKTRSTKSSSQHCAQRSAALLAFFGGFSASVSVTSTRTAAACCASSCCAAFSAASRSILLRRRTRLTFSSSLAFFKHQPRPMSSKTFSMVSQASVQVRTLWSLQFMSDSCTASRTVRMRAMREQSPPKMSASSWRFWLVAATMEFMKSRASSKVFK